MKVLKRGLLGLFTIALLFALQTVPVFASEVPETIKIENRDLTGKIRVNEIPKEMKIEQGTADMADSRITVPYEMLIESIIATPYGKDKSTGIIYSFPNYQVGAQTIYPTNQLVYSYDVANTNIFVQDLDNAGYDLLGWDASMKFHLNTSLIPKMLESSINNVQMPFIQLSSSDKGRPLYYNYNIPAKQGGEFYQGLVQGYLVCMNYDMTASRSPFASGLMFNNP